jgi:hypothetical protein
MRHALLLSCAALALIAAPAFAQMGGGMGEGMGGGMGQGMGGGGRGGHRGGQRGGGDQAGGKDGAPSGPTRPAPQLLPVAMRLTGVINIIGQSKVAEGGSVASIKPDVSAIFISRGGALTLKNVALTTSGPVSLIDDSRGSGLDSALLINESGQADMTGGKIDTSGLGANAAYVAGPGAKLSLQDVVIATTASNAHGVDAVDGAAFSGARLSISTMGDNAPAIASRRAQPMTLSDLTLHTAASDSPLLRAAGDMTVTNAKGQAERDDGLAVLGARHVNLQTPDFQADGYAISVSGATPGASGDGGGPAAGGPQGPIAGPGADAASDDPDSGKIKPVASLLSTPAQATGAEVTVNGGTLSGERAVLSVSNAHAHIVLTGVALKSGSGLILKAAAGQTGALGRNGGDADLELHGETVSGDFSTDVISSIRVSLLDQSHLTGRTTSNTDVTLDAGSDWTLVDDAHVGKLVVTGLASPDAIVNIRSGGHTLYYDPHRNPWLDHKTWPLPGGGQLTPDV